MDEREYTAIQAMMEGMDTQFRNMTTEAVRINREVAQRLASGADRPRVVSMGRQAIATVFTELIKQDAHPDDVFNYVLFLIGEIDARMKRDLQLNEKFNELANCMARMSEAMGLAPLFAVPPPAAFDSGKNTYTTSSGQVLENVHPQQECTGFCVIHDPIPGPWDGWEIVWRGDGLFDTWRGFERICPHGIGHPAAEETLRDNGHPHGCCGLCPCGPGIAEPIIDLETGQLRGYRG